MAGIQPLVVSDLLCYATKKFGRVPLKPLKSVLNDFYSADDICMAKDLLVDEVEKLTLDKWSKPARRRKDSITRTQNEIDDIMHVIIMLDETQNMHRLPSFVASDPDRMPSIKLTDGDLAAVLLKLNALEMKLSELNESIRNEASKQVTTIDPKRVVFSSKPPDVRGGAPSASTSHAAHPSSYGPTSSDAGETSDNDGFDVQRSRKKRKQSVSPKQSGPLSATSPTSGPSYATVVTLPGPTAHKPAVKSKPRTVIGASSSCLLRASKTLIIKKSVFRLGNIDSTYTAMDVETYVRSLGVRILTCFELKQSPSQSEDNKSFRVCIVTDDNLKLCDSDNWSVGVTIRAWVHKPKTAAAGGGSAAESAGGGSAARSAGGGFAAGSGGGGSAAGSGGGGSAGGSGGGGSAAGSGGGGSAAGSVIVNIANGSAGSSNISGSSSAPMIIDNHST
jgi:hypothetical protein